MIFEKNRDYISLATARDISLSIAKDQCNNDLVFLLPCTDFHILDQLD